MKFIHLLLFEIIFEMIIFVVIMKMEQFQQKIIQKNVNNMNKNGINIIVYVNKGIIIVIATLHIVNVKNKNIIRFIRFVYLGLFIFKSNTPSILLTKNISPIINAKVSTRLKNKLKTKQIILKKRITTALLNLKKQCLIIAT